MRLARIDVAIAALAMIVTVLAVTWGVITRYVTAQPAVWASEVAAIAFAWLTFFGASACFAAKQADAPKKVSQAKAIAATSLAQTAGCAVT